jgi:hypothetical protein
MGDTHLHPINHITHIIGEIRLPSLSVQHNIYFNPIFHSPGHIWPGFLNASSSKSFKQKDSEKIVVLENCFLYMFCWRTFPHNDAFLTYYRKSTKNPKVQVILDLGHGNPATLGRKNRTCLVMAPLVLTWSTQLVITVTCVWRGEGGGPLTWQPLAQNLNVLLIYQISKYIQINNCQLGRQHKQYWSLSCQ